MENKPIKKYYHRKQTKDYYTRELFSELQLIHPDISNILYLLDNGADIKARDKDGNTPMHWAVRTRNIELISLLKDKGADVASKNHDGLTPLGWLQSLEMGMEPTDEIIHYIYKGKEVTPAIRQKGNYCIDYYSYDCDGSCWECKEIQEKQENK